MLYVAICDDSTEDLSYIQALIETYNKRYIEQHTIKYESFSNAMDLIDAMQGGQHYDLVILDIIMPLMTGIEAAKEIRQFNQNIKIIFSTSSPEYAIESYTVNAYYYYLKPISQESLFSILSKIITEIESDSTLSILIKSKIGLTKIYYSKLEFAEVIGRVILYHLTDGSIIEAIGAIKILEKDLLLDPRFIKPHRSYIINMDYIETLWKREIRMQSSSVIPIAKTKLSDIKLAYLSFTFKV